MADAAKEPLLKRRMAPPRPIKAAGAGAIEKLLGVVFPRSADQLLELQVDIRSVGFGQLDQAAVVTALKENDLICRMTRAGSNTGLVVVDPPLLSALIEIQTLGKVTDAPPNERSATRTDATVVGDILDRWLSDAASAAKEQGLTPELLTNGYARVDGLLDLRAIDLTLDPGQYGSMSVTMALGGDIKAGTLTFYAPVSTASQDDTFGSTLGHQLRPHLLDAPVEMTAVLARTSRSLDEVMSLNAGDVFPVLSEQLQSVRLETGNGTLVTTARLGQIGGNRAVRPAGTENPQQALPGPNTGAFQTGPGTLAHGGAAVVPQMGAGLDADAATSGDDSLKPPAPLSELPDPEPAGA